MKTRIAKLAVLCRLALVVTGLVAILGLTGQAWATIITPVTATATSTFGGRPAVNTINSSGLVAGLHDADFNNMWMSAALGPTVMITWDLGANYSLTGFHLWNYNEADFENDRSVNTADILVADDAAFTVNLQTFASVSFIQAPGTPGYAGEDYPLAASGQFVRFTNLTTFGDPSFTGLSEIRFAGDLPVPEPSAVVLLSVGGLWLWLRRRNG